MSLPPDLRADVITELHRFHARNGRAPTEREVADMIRVIDARAGKVSAVARGKARGLRVVRGGG